MTIDKSQIFDMLESGGDTDQAAQADHPGVDPKDLIGKFGGSGR